ncbi:hypothetical protein LQ567_07415 [Niabella pedocola]|uniref:Uncharacterized protein n=1 Tax=Niabella pedocola TaxID=1752077 RepID=A0ABS8PN98_9BACT|nr:hypothetical protein [Niabella pedocola]MCD2422587.1 hypothetical protein [Niabella pedocola]
MKRRLLFLFFVTGCAAPATAQTSISNGDGTYSLFYYSPYGSTIIYPDGTHALLVDYDSTHSMLVYSDFSFSRFFYNGSTTTIVHSDYSYAIFHNAGPAPAADPIPPDDTLFSAGISDTIKNKANNGYFLLSDDTTIKPDPGEARYILLNNLVDTITMRSRSAPPQQPPSDPAAHPDDGTHPIPRLKDKQTALRARASA